uniref:NADH-ubiquinone oxidoreductase chain 4L n=1 Tax=Parasagitta elegans TaxID=1562708 RepID=A0A141CLK4_9BILA|nr:NADH dehydrogenase subunit 4L [Parasagitta elegans]
MWLKWLLVMTSLLVIAVYTKKSSLSMLLCLEAMVILGVMVLMSHSESMFSVCFISIGACESAVGIACLVSLVRSQGTEMYSL